MRGGIFGGMFDFAGVGGPALFVVIALCLVGFICAIRGFWGSSTTARRMAIVAALLLLPVGFVVGGWLLIDGYRVLARLGPAATPADEGYVWRRALSPAVAAALALCVVIATGGLGWVVGRTDRGPEPPPRKPAR